MQQAELIARLERISENADWWVQGEIETLIDDIRAGTNDD